jgi:hypothetical protein
MDFVSLGFPVPSKLPRRAVRSVTIHNPRQLYRCTIMSNVLRFCGRRGVGEELESYPGRRRRDFGGGLCIDTGECGKSASRRMSIEKGDPYAGGRVSVGAKSAELTIDSNRVALSKLNSNQVKMVEDSNRVELNKLGQTPRSSIVCQDRTELGELAGGLKIRDGDALAEKRITMTKSIMATSRDVVLTELKATKAGDSSSSRGAGQCARKGHGSWRSTHASNRIGAIWKTNSCSERSE